MYRINIAVSLLLETLKILVRVHAPTKKRFVIAFGPFLEYRKSYKISEVVTSKSCNPSPKASLSDCVMSPHSSE